MAPSPANRPFGVSFLSLLLIIGGIVDVIAGILVWFNDDAEVLKSISHTQGEIRTYAIVSIIIGVVVVLLGFALRRGSNLARTFIGLIALIRLGTLVWVVIAYHQVHWYQALWPAVIYLLVAGYLFLDEDAKAFFAGRR
jgi:hypothetical protein